MNNFCIKKGIIEISMHKLFFGSLQFKKITFLKKKKINIWDFYLIPVKKVSKFIYIKAVYDISLTFLNCLIFYKLQSKFSKCYNYFIYILFLTSLILLMLPFSQFSWLYCFSYLLSYYTYHISLFYIITSNQNVFQWVFLSASSYLLFLRTPLLNI